jgi:hypothetical protein
MDSYVAHEFSYKHCGPDHCRHGSNRCLRLASPFSYAVPVAARPAGYGDVIVGVLSMVVVYLLATKRCIRLLTFRLIQQRPNPFATCGLIGVFTLQISVLRPSSAF